MRSGRGKRWSISAFVAPVVAVVAVVVVVGDARLARAQTTSTISPRTPITSAPPARPTASVAGPTPTAGTQLRAVAGPPGLPPSTSVRTTTPGAAVASGAPRSVVPSSTGLTSAATTVRPSTTGLTSAATTLRPPTTLPARTVRPPTTLPTTTVRPPTTTLPSTTLRPPTTTAKSGLRITTTRTLAAGALRFEPVEPSAKVIRSKASVVRTAKRELPTGTAAPTPEVFFARYALETNERVTGGTGQLKRDLRTVWVVRFAGVEGRRQSSVVIRQNLPTIVPVTTIAPIVFSDIVVVIDDATGNVLLRSEFAPETDTAR